ncbi:histidine--tRNA ligase [bacterium CG2_30_37_16]|nr:MAG: histidine--tRNA ligase [bacterium CG2_30_37_16]PIP30237.1 MAG: histidine--tRNA ligase [bacterium (Candidatus Howlettbacteria) CG23_combo_of_CG06-09_8_20_14_all_37_9]PIX98933.1 MAG: histidine--tRNA ligase [bacterium (Candidatus Howlettbacteria) CG_4_10_14_3_um_filter_37_10]PJB07233.1 MAG: histidine--tRNA ligase [bacterium (Candidatus Howlettbacteria) CG_4_9_14_3_um_filter_37_10]
MAKKIIQKPRGTQDILPADQKYWNFVVDNFRNVLEGCGFGRIITPTFEDTALFERGIGTSTDIVEKEMYTFKDKSDNSITLRPEGTASVVRAYLEDGISSWLQPVKLYYINALFRYERPQAGRFREHHQIGAEIIGDPSPLRDVEMIALISRCLKRLHLDNVSLQLNSIGCQVCRPQYMRSLKAYYKEHLNSVCEDCTRRYDKNPLRLLDCKEKACRLVADNAPQLINTLCPDCHEHFRTILEFLDDLGVSYELNTKLVRGLDYYTRTVFEFWYVDDNFGSQNAICGGGRYDMLVEILGGKPTAGIGFGVGIERLMLVLKNEESVLVPELNAPKIYLAQLGGAAKKQAFMLAQSLLDNDIPIASRFDKKSVGEQLKEASDLKVPYAIIIGQKETIDGTAIVKDMYTGFQETLPQEMLVSEVIKRLS